MKKVTKHLITTLALAAGVTIGVTNETVKASTATLNLNNSLKLLSTTFQTSSTSSPFEHTVPTTIDSFQDAPLTTTLIGKTATSVTLHYQLENDSTWYTKVMTNSNNTFTSVLTAKERNGQNVNYYFTTIANGESVTSPTYILPIATALNYEKVPELLITEIMPYSDKVNGAEAYEFVEVYNNTPTTIDLKNYNIQYRYPSLGTKGDLVWPVDPKESLYLEPGKTMVYWIMTDKTKQLTVADFNKQYGTNLVENKDIVRIDGLNLANSDSRGLVIGTDTRIDISHALYNETEGVKDVSKNKALLYTYPTNGSKKVSLISSKKLKGTPGTVESYQVPPVKTSFKTSVEAPIIYENQRPEEANTTADADFVYEIKSDTNIKNATFFYKRDGDEDYTAINIMRTAFDKLYHVSVPQSELQGHTSFSYYVTATDGTKTSRIEEAEVDIIGYEKVSGLKVNIDKDAILSKTVAINIEHPTNNAKSKLLIDNKDVTSALTDQMANEAYLAFDANKTNNYFINGVAIGKTILKTFEKRIDEYTTITTPIPTKYFTKGSKRTIDIHAGSKNGVFDETNANKNDFYIRNIRLVLNDGTVIRPSNYTDPKKILNIGDNSISVPTLSPTFTLPNQAFDAKSYSLNSKELSDGKHTLTIKNGSTKKNVTFYVDNKAPTITTTLKNNTTYKGDISIQAEAKDQTSSVKTLKATLDGKTIKLPYNTSTAKLTAGSHKLVLKATDTVGNSASKTITFKTEEEMPFVPELLSPKNNANVSATPALKVKVSDPTNDALNLVIQKAYSYTPADEAVLTKQLNADKEPPTTIESIGETDADVKAMEKVDSKYVTTSSKEKFPYHRFQLTLDPSVKATDEIAIHWTGKSLMGRKVTMYVWDYKKEKWIAQTWKVAQNNKNFSLDATITGANYNQDHKVHVLVQDELADTTQFDYSFIWMSDTQYYTKSYPTINQQMTEWIAKQKEALNIQYVFHTGDLVDDSTSSKQWKVADTSMQTLEQAGIPYGVLAGNHDVAFTAADYTAYSKYFGEKRFNTQDYFGGSYSNNRGHYDLIDVKGTQYIMLYMGWDIGEKEIKWMNEVLAKYPERKAFLNFHEYVDTEGERTDTGEMIYEKVVKPNKNVLAVLSGHLFDAETITTEIDDNGDGKADRTVYEMLANYQGGPEGGQGFMRILQVNPVTNEIHVSTYSPYLDQYNFFSETEYPGKDSFTMKSNIAPEDKVVATDAIDFKVYTDEKLTSFENVDSNSTVERHLPGLIPNTKYSWYATVNDQFNGSARSAIQSFKTTANYVEQAYLHTVTVKDSNGEVVGSFQAENYYDLTPLEADNRLFVGYYKDKKMKTVLPKTTKFTKATTIYANYTLPPKATTLKKPTTDYNYVQLNWAKVSDATSYEVYRSTKKSSGFKKIATVSGTSFKNWSVNENTTYYYKIKAVKTIGNKNLTSAYSTVVQTKTALKTPKLTKLTKHNKTVTGTYARVNGAQKYAIYRSENGKTYKYLKQQAATTNTFKDTSVKKGKKYYYKIRTYRTATKKYYSSYSNVKSVKL